MDHPIEAIKKESCQIIIPYSQVKPDRTHDIYVVQLGSVHKVVPDGMYVAIVSTVVETGNPEEELQPGLALLGSTIERFMSVSDQFVPVDDGRNSRCFISESYDSSSHFEGAAKNILDLYERITGKPYDFDSSVNQQVTMQ
eukprot:Sspe_Gene.61481::Locus_34124_Transcript_1_1_Confidence_1.000_Length_1534::g.61481::m.61481/K17255/GDI1_2; Rab GDP dissociation inhibitor